MTVPAVRAITLAQYDYFPSNAPSDADGFAVPAQIVATQPSQGISVAVPASGLVVLTSRGASPPAALDQGATILVDDLRNFQLTFSHTAHLKLDSSTPAEFNFAASRATPAGKRPQALIYRAPQMTSFDLDVYYATSSEVHVYGSTDGSAWSPIAVESTQPAPAVGGHELLVQLLPAQPLPAGTNRLEIQLAPGTQLAQVQIAANRSGPACVSATPTPAETARQVRSPNSVAALTPGISRRSVADTYGVPGTKTARVWRYCTTTPGQLAIVFAGERSQLIGTNATGARLGAIAVGAPLGRLYNSMRKTGLTSAGRHLLISSAGVVYATRALHVVSESLTTPALLAHPAALILAIRRAGLT